MQRIFSPVPILLLATIASVRSFQTFQARIPNGAIIPNPCNPPQIWPGVGHQASAGAGPRNPFGLAFDSNGQVYNRALCLMDSDQDGVINGAELGDPDCVWVAGGTPTRTTGLSHPGICEPLTLPKCQQLNTFINCTPPTGASTEPTKPATSFIQTFTRPSSTTVATTVAQAASTTTRPASPTTVAQAASTTTRPASPTTVGQVSSTTTRPASPTTVPQVVSTTTARPTSATVNPLGSPTTLGQGVSTTRAGQGLSSATAGQGVSTTTAGQGGSTTTLGQGGSTVTTVRLPTTQTTVVLFSTPNTATTTRPISGQSTQSMVTTTTRQNPVPTGTTDPTAVHVSTKHSGGPYCKIAHGAAETLGAKLFLLFGTGIITLIWNLIW